MFYCDENDELLAKILHKFTLVIFGGPQIRTASELFLRLDNFFEVDSKTNNKYYYPISQHIITNIFPRFSNITKNVLEILTENKIDYSAFSDQRISPINVVEAIVSKNTLLNNIETTDKFRIVAQNPDNPKGIDLLYVDASYKQAKQPHMDFRLENYFIEAESNKLVFLDSKLIADPLRSLSLTKGFLSLTTTLELKFFMARFKGDLEGKIPGMALNPMEYKILKDFCNILDTILKNKRLTEDEKYASFKKEKTKLLLNNQVKSIVPSFINSPKINTQYNDYIQQNSQEYSFIIDYIKNNIVKDDLQKMFKSTRELNEQNAYPEFWHDKIYQIIILLPQEHQNACLENYQIFNLLEYGHDLL